jgi:hypothetical protein
MSAEEELRAAFLKVRRRIDPEEVMDGFDFARGWLLGRGVRDSIALDWIDKWAEMGVLTWPARENMKAMVADDVARQKFVDTVVGSVTE